ncbi:MAG: cytidine deaminase [Moorea sp. SIO2B7]|nr:cytidine deaminase [Moorena sp. SIO2B7]
MNSFKLPPEEKAKLLEIAQNAMQKAYAPYSKFRVGAALLTESGKIFQGCNIENSSYGLTICAERVAIASAIAEEGGNKMKIKAIAVVNDHKTPCSPCGACRQVILEFGVDSLIIFRGREGIQQRQAKELLPEGFFLANQINEA